MKIEHTALNVPDALSMARWYVEHLGLTVKRRVLEEPWAHFLADDGDHVMLELYSNREFEFPDYFNIPPASLHIAFTSDDIPADTLRLKLAGATVLTEDSPLPGGDSMAMLRDPWGICLQLIRRKQPMI